MRRKEEVLQQILNFVKSEDRVRAAVMNGSRVNTNAPRDIMQDYDVALYVTNVDDMHYKLNREWIEQFGELVILQQNDFDEGYIFLMQFRDGVRIDLGFNDINQMNRLIREDTLSRVILDKDNLVGEIPSANDSMHHVKRPDKGEFDALVNEAWWIQTYVAKGIWRDELPYVKYMYDVILMDCVRQLLMWKIGLEHDWSINPGKMGKWFKRYLAEETYNEFSSLFPGSDYNEIWDCLFMTGVLIRKIGTELAQDLGYEYPMQDDINVTEFLGRIKRLPSGAEDFI
jgi:aminoglycoside 6-adenylyltransferase